MTPEERLTKIENAIHALIETQARHEGELSKLHAGIQDLIKVSRTLTDSQIKTDAQINGLAEAQKHTDIRLTALIDVVDRIIRRENGR